MAEMVFIRTAYLTPTAPGMYRAGQHARIGGVVLVAPPESRMRLCFHVEWPDGVQDFFPVEDGYSYRIHGYEEA